jgi:hypothetical protein
MTLSKIKQLAHETELYDAADPCFATVVLLLSAFFNGSGSGTDHLHRFTGYPHEWIKPRLDRLIAQGVITPPDKMRVEWVEESDHWNVALCLDVMTAEGKVRRSLDAEGRIVYQRVAVPYQGFGRPRLVAHDGTCIQCGDFPVLSRGMCSKHYYRWRYAQRCAKQEAA